MELADIIDFLKEAREAGEMFNKASVDIIPGAFIDVLNFRVADNPDLNRRRVDGRWAHSFEYRGFTYRTCTELKIDDL